MNEDEPLPLLEHVDNEGHSSTSDTPPDVSRQRHFDEPSNEDDKVYYSWRMQWTRRVIACLLIFAVLVILVKLGGHGHGHMQLNAGSAAPLNPPKLVLYPSLQNLPYCGFQPLVNKTWPYIPQPATKYKLVGVSTYIRHGDRFFNQGRGSWCWPGQNRTKYHCDMTHISIPGTSLMDTRIHASRLFRKRFMPDHNDFEGNCKVGQLSTKGFEQERTLGEIFRKAYIPSLLSPTLKPKEVYFRSDDIPRTILSAEALVSGMFPIESSKNVSGQEIVDIYTMDFDRETEISNAHECPGLTKHTEKAFASEEVLNHFNLVKKPLEDKLSVLFGMREINIFRAMDCFYVSVCRGREAPEGVTTDILDKAEQCGTFNFTFPLRYPDRVTGSKQAAGPLVRELMNRLQALKKKTNSPKFYLYSGHDTGPILLLLSSLGVIDDKSTWPPYASYIAIELYTDDKSAYFVRVVYNGKILHIPGCTTTWCTYNEFDAYMSPLIPSRVDCPGVYRDI